MESVLRVRGVKNVDLRAAGLKVRFELEASSPIATAGVHAPIPRSGNKGGNDGESRDNGIGLGEEARGGTEDSGDEAEGVSGAPPVADAFRQLQLSVGCCIYQKGKYLLGHAESCDDSSATGHHPPVLSRTPPRSPPLSLVRSDTGDGKAGGERGAAFASPTQPAPRPDGNGSRLSPAYRKSVSTPHDTAMSPSWPQRSPPRERETGVLDTEELHGWGGGPGPRPCEEALTVVKSLRVPLSDPHYFRVADVSLSLLEEGGGFVRRVPMLRGGEGADDGWEGEVLVTRCAVVGNPRQPRTRADAMLSRMRVEVRSA